MITEYHVKLTKTGTTHHIAKSGAEAHIWIEKASQVLRDTEYHIERVYVFDRATTPQDYYAWNFFPNTINSGF